MEDVAPSRDPLLLFIPGQFLAHISANPTILGQDYNQEVNEAGVHIDLLVYSDRPNFPHYSVHVQSAL